MYEKRVSKYLWSQPPAALRAENRRTLRSWRPIAAPEYLCRIEMFNGACETWSLEGRSHNRVQIFLYVAAQNSPVLAGPILKGPPANFPSVTESTTKTVIPPLAVDDRVVWFKGSEVVRGTVKFIGKTRESDITEMMAVEFVSSPALFLSVYDTHYQCGSH